MCFSFENLTNVGASRIPRSIFMATVILPSLPGKLVAVPRATWPNAPPPMTFSMITFSLSTSHERVPGLSGAYSFISKLLCVGSVCSLSSNLISLKGMSSPESRCKTSSDMLFSSSSASFCNLKEKYTAHSKTLTSPLNNWEITKKMFCLYFVVS